MEKNLLELLKLGTKSMLGLFIGLAIAIFLIHLNVITLDGLPKWVWPALLIGICISGALSFVNLVAVIINQVKKHIANRQRAVAMRDRQSKALAYLDTLNSGERQVIAYLTQNNERSLTAPLGQVSVTSLNKKGLLTIAHGVQSVLDTVYLMPEFVWTEIQMRKTDFLSPQFNEPFEDDGW